MASQTLASEAAADALRAAFGNQLRESVMLAQYTSARIGGPADYLLVAKKAGDLREAARLAWAHDLPLFVMGGGSNLLVADAGVRGLVVVNRARTITFERTRVRAESGASLSTLAQRCIHQGLAGLEWAIGVPGTVGGAVVGNAGAHGDDMSGVVARALIFEADGTERAWSNAELGFAYRSSAIKRGVGKSVILSVDFTLTEEPSEAIGARADEYNAYRKATQPPGASIGSMFKNPPDDYAGRLIDAAGLKGKRVGKAQISPVHANFFVNLGEARAADVLGLIEAARQAVLEQFGVALELEIQLVGEWQ